LRRNSAFGRFRRRGFPPTVEALKRRTAWSQPQHQRREEADVQTISAQDLKFMWDRGEDFVLVNTLPREHFAATKVLAAVNVPEAENEFAARALEKVGSLDRTVVLYCANRDCDSSHRAAQKLLDANFEDVWVFEDGADGWREFANKAKGSSVGRW
jgi:rhodanese-related sulfurtransferase